MLTVAGCASSPTDPATPATPAATESSVPHGYVEGASEETEPQLQIATVDAAGSLSLLDLLSEESAEFATLDGITAVSTDGRYVFASAAESGELSIIDSGTWTVDHEDHSHYYRATPSEVGTIDGEGDATVHTGGAITAVFFADSGEGIILDHEALGDGEITELGTISGAPHEGALVPFGGSVIATEASADGTVTGLRAYSPDGTAAETGDSAGSSASSSAGAADAAVECTGFSGTITTNVGAVFGCDDGAVLATVAADDTVEFERIAYPAGTIDAAPGAAPATATAFASRPGRPTVAALAGTTGAWLLDTRERTWTRLLTEVPLLRVVAADDRNGNVVALASDGRILVLDPATGATVAATEPLLAATIAAAAADPVDPANPVRPGDPATPSILDGVNLTVDDSRAYVNAISEGLVYEIDYADGARVARTFEAPDIPLFLVETGR
ncbi:hypothetical protein B0I08_10930 [Glaciihabitans tibetensis]|uniref:ABC transporter n=1 Tax=Glaciihabitans tibetensis TaxID=1266600 RepID=A0A2T0V6R7_9MICO|nr:hypothetical protein B0I08_10930 [Glaciihabitans tibetensis]